MPTLQGPRILAVLALTVAMGGTAAGDPPAPDLRLRQPIHLRSEARPVGQVLERISAATGIRLSADPAAAKERLVAFVPDRPVSEVMACLAELYRGEWRRTNTGNGPEYQLYRPTETLREEAALREAGFRQALAPLLQRMQSLAADGPGDGSRKLDLGNGEVVRVGVGTRPLFQVAMPLVEAQLPRLQQEGYVYQPISAYPPEVRERLVLVLQPWLDAHHQAIQAIQRNLVEQDRAQGKTPPNFPPSQPSRAEQCSLVLELQYKEGLAATVGLRAPGDRYLPWYTGSGVAVGDDGASLYARHHPRPLSGGEASPTLPAPDDPFNTPVQVEIKEAIRDRWVQSLGVLAERAGIPVYADWYAPRGILPEGHGLAPDALSGKVPVHAALNRLCGITNTAKPGAEWRRFWWRKGSAALVRSRSWLWDAEAALPADLTERLGRSLRASRRISPAEVTVLGTLSALQVFGIQTSPGGLDAWRSAVQLPAGFTLSARERLLQGGVSGDTLLPADRLRLTSQLRPDEVGTENRYAAALESSLETRIGTTLPVAALRLRATLGNRESTAWVEVPLPDLQFPEVTVNKSAAQPVRQ